MDGRQHFEDIPHWNSCYKDQRQRDVYKMTKANEQGYNVLRLLQTEVFSDKNNWEQLLDMAIKNIEYNPQQIINQYNSKSCLF